MISPFVLAAAIAAFAAATALPYTPEPRRVRLACLGLTLWSLATLLARLSL